jgi:hypothetical protein
VKSVRLLVEIGGGSTPKKKRKKSARRTPAAEANQGAITIEPSLGFKAELLDDDRLSITQDNHEAEADCVVLSRTDFKIIRGQFDEWADAQPSK